jgi:hypothetical protein
VLQKTSKKGEKMYTIQVPESYVEDMINLMEPEDRAGIVGKWLQGDIEPAGLETKAVASGS